MPNSKEYKRLVIDLLLQKNTTFVQGFCSYTSSIDHYYEISCHTKAVVLRILSGILSSSLLEELSVTTVSHWSAKKLIE